jgi:hypothetical protein
MSPDDDVRALPTGAPSEKLSIIFAGVSIVTSIPKIVLELFGDRPGALRSFAVHPDQKPGRWSRQTIPSATDTAPIWPTSPRSQRIDKLYGREAL